MFTFGLPLLIDPFRPDFYKLSKSSRTRRVDFNNTNNYNSKDLNSNSALQKKPSTNSSSTNQTINSNADTNKQESDNSNETNKVVSLTTIGQGKTLNEAKLFALRSSIEPTYGAFVSSETKIINDELVKDDINTISKGNIENFEIISQEQLKDQSWLVTIKSLISLKKLEGYCKSKGNEVTIDGQSFAFAAKLAKLNQKAEIKAVENLLVALDKMLENAFDYKVEARGPTVSGEVYKVEYTVQVFTNKNWETAFNFFFSSLSSIVLNGDEINNYQSLGYKTEPSPTLRPLLPVDEFDWVKKNHSKFNLRTFQACLLLIDHFEKIGHIKLYERIDENEFIFKRFFVDDGIQKIDYHAFSVDEFCNGENRYSGNRNKSILEGEPYSYRLIGEPYSRFCRPLYICPAANQRVNCYSLKKYYSSEELEKLKKVTVSPLPAKP